MASLILKVTPEEVQEKANQIKGQKAQMESEMRNMMSKVARLHDSWDSRSGKDYQAKFQNVTREINDSLNALQKHADNLTKAAHEYSHTERSNAAKVRSLSAENIF